MTRHLFLLALTCCLPGWAAGQDRVTFLDRSSRSNAPVVRTGAISAEDPAKLTITSNDNRRTDVPSFDIVDVQYEAEPAAEMNAARAAERDRKWDVALAAYSDALKKATPAKPLLRRHLEYKVAELRTAQADAGGNPGPAVDALRAFIKTNADARQALACLENLGRLLVTSRQPTSDVVQALAQLRSKYGIDSKELAGRCDLLRIDLIALDLELTYAKEGPEAGAKKSAEAAKALEDVAKTADRSAQAELIARQAFCQALAGALPTATSAWESQLKSAEDPRTRAAAHLARGDFLRVTQKHREAMWDYLWVDTVYFAEREQQAKALYHLAEIFDKLGDAPKSREARDRLHADARLKETRYQKMTTR
jgi:hypothetical protein